MENQTAKTGIIYVRVSSAEQVNGTSLAMQERLCREYAERESIAILGVYVEEGESAKTANRTQFQKALAFCSIKKNPVNFFIVHKVDRFARNQNDHHATRAVLKRYGTELRSVTEPISEDAVGKAMEGMLSVFAEFDNNVRAARSRSGMVEKVKRGEWVWAAPIGYKRLIKGGNLVVDDEAAPHIRKIFEEYAKGTHTFDSLARLMVKRGMKTRHGKEPRMQLMEKILRNPVYYGVIKGFGMEIKASFAPLIEEDLYWRCQPSVRGKRGSARTSENPHFPLRRFAICTECGKSLTGSASTGRKGKKYRYYHHQTQDCPAAVAIPKGTLEQNFVEFLQEISPTLRSEKAFRLIVADVWQENFKKLDAENARIRKEVEVLEQERQRVFEKYRAGKYTDEEFIEQKTTATQAVQRKKLLLEEKRIEEFNIDEALEHCFNFVRDSGKMWQQLAHTPSLRARFQKSVFPEKVSFNGKEFGTTKMSLVYKLNQEKTPDKTKLVTQVGENWHQLVWELNGWLLLGRDLSKT